MFSIYVDDSGSTEYINPYSKDFIKSPPPFQAYESFWRNNYFVLCGVRVANMYKKELNENINELKKTYFGTHKVEIKSDWLRNPKRREKHYSDIYKIDNAQLDEFGEQIFKLIAKERKYLQLATVVFDKRFYGDSKRNVPEGNILGKTTQVLLERIHYLGCNHNIIFDQMMSSLKLNVGKHERIINVWKNNSGMKKIHVKDYTYIKDISFKKSSSENFLQIADICAYTIYRQFVHHGRQWLQRKSKELETYCYFDKVRCNFISHKGKVSGVGLVCIPDVIKKDWNILDGCDVI